MFVIFGQQMYTFSFYFLPLFFKKTVFIDWNLIPYAEAWQQQTEWFDGIVRAKAEGEPYENHIIMCEHPHALPLWDVAERKIICC